LDVLPEAIDGTFWYRSADGLTIGDVETKLRIKDRQEKVKVSSMYDLLLANAGKVVTLTLRTMGQTPATETVTGELIGSSPSQPGAPLLMKLLNGEYRSFGLGEVIQMKADPLVTEVERTTRVPDIAIRFRAKSGSGAKLQFLTLETGAAWVGSYLVTIGKEQKAVVEGKAQVGVGPLKLDATRVFALAGSPNLQTGSKFDLAAGYGSLMSYLHGNQAQYRQFRPGPVDPYTLLATLNQQNRQGYPYGYYGGGFGGGGMGGGMGGGGGFDMDGNVAFNRPDQETDLNNLPQQAGISRVESLFSYPLGELSLDPGDRLTRIMFSQVTNYVRLLKWYADPGANSVNDTLRVNNNSKVPWTGGKAFILRDDTPLAQIEMPFTPVGQDADLNLGLAHDVVVSRDDRQIRNDEYTSPNWPRLILRKVLNEIKLTVTNTRDVAVRLEASTVISGEPVSVELATVTKLTQQTDQFNWKKAVKWTLDLAPGERREVVFTYSSIISMGFRPG
ncbi:MAG TPA: hypothetical protein VK934_03990, partial [Fimbriimonas sp.]|nr:hypothetical protein [Fimbriimonas sp.]